MPVGNPAPPRPRRPDLRDEVDQLDGVGVQGDAATGAATRRDVVVEGAMLPDREDPMDHDVRAGGRSAHRHRHVGTRGPGRPDRPGARRSRRSTGSIEAKATPNSGYGKSTAIRPRTARWNVQARAIHVYAQRRPSRASGAPSSTTRVTQAPTWKINGWPTANGRDRRPGVAEQALAQVVVGDEAQQPVAGEPVEPAAEAQLGDAGDEVGGHGHGAHHLQRPTRGRRRTSSRRRGGEHEEVQDEEVLGVQDLTPRGAERSEPQEPDRRTAAR